MRLIDAGLGQVVRVTGFRGGHTLGHRLRQLGLQPGDRARVTRHAPFGGPVMIEVNGRTLALGRGIAAKIWVEVEQKNS